MPKQSLADALAVANARPTTGTCPDCGRAGLHLHPTTGNIPRHTVPGRATGKRVAAGPTYCTGAGKQPVAPDEPTPEVSLDQQSGETKGAWKTRLEALGHRFRRAGRRDIHDSAHCDACLAAIGATPTSHPATGEWIEPSLDQQTLAAEIPAGAWSGGQAAELNPWEIDPDPDNARGDDYGDLDELAASLITEGMLQPVIVIPNPFVDSVDRYQLVAGHRRVAAARRANLATVPALVRPDLADARRLAAAQATENLQRRNLNAIQEAKAYRRLVDAGAKQDEIANRVGVNQGHVSKRLSLLKLEPNAQESVAAGEISIEDAVEVARLPKGAQPLAVSLLLSNNPRGAVARAKGEWARQAARQAVLDRLEADGVPVIEIVRYQWPDDLAPVRQEALETNNVYASRGVVDQTPGQHKRCPGHAAAVFDADHTTGEPFAIYLCTDPARHGLPDKAERSVERDAEEVERHALRAAEKAARLDQHEQLASAARVAAGTKIPRPTMGDMLAWSTVLGMADHGVFLPGTTWDVPGDTIDTLTVLEHEPTLEAIAAGVDLTEPDSKQLPVLKAAAIEQVGPLRFAYAASVLAITRALIEETGWRMGDAAGHPALHAFYELLQVHAGYQLADGDRAWLEAPTASWEPSPMPETVPDGAVAWYVGNPDDETDEARWLDDPSEASVVAEMFPNDRVQMVPDVRDACARPEEVRGARSEDELVPGERCPGSGREFAGVAGGAVGVSCPKCGAEVDNARKGGLSEHLVPEVVV